MQTSAFYKSFILIIHEVDRMENFIYEYFIQPIISRSGYNIVNTVVYAIIAIIAIYAIYKAFRRSGINIDRNFLLGTISFVLLGSTVRVVTDSIDSKVFSPITPVHEMIINSHIYDYGFFTVTPGIYIVIATIFLATVFVLHRLKKLNDLWKVGIALWLPHFLILVPFSKYFLLCALIVVLAALPAFIARKILKNDVLAGIVAAHSLDGAATFVAIEIAPQFAPIAYFEQHVFSRMLGGIGGNFVVFYIAKIAVSLIAAWLIKNEKMDDDEMRYLALVLIIMGLAPGVRDTLRLLVGA